MNNKDKIENVENLICNKCNVPLEEGKVFLTYLGNTFPTRLLKCPKCGICFIPEEMANTKAVTVEKSVEEK